MSSSRKKSKVDFNQADRQWIDLVSVQEKIESMRENVVKYIEKASEGKTDANIIVAAIVATQPHNFYQLSGVSIHDKHMEQEKIIIKQERGKKRKGRIDHECEKCHNEINEVYYRWLARATADIRKRTKKSATGEKSNNADSSKASESKDKGKQRAISVESNQGQNDSDSTINLDDTSSAECPICCNEDIPAKELTKCSNGHRFCISCAQKMAETEIGFQRTKFTCMHEGCASVFSDLEIKRFLSDKIYQLWFAMRTNEFLKSANIDDLESCPFCIYAHVVYPEDRDKPFFCQNSECGKWSCLACKRLAHEGKSCEEARQANMTSEHKAEEKLAEALMRRCPKAGCNTVMVKDEGQRSCNKMKCVKCKTVICYVCRKEITTEGYAHFEHNPDLEAGNSNKKSEKCPLWDDTKERHKEDVSKARKEAGKLAPQVTEAEVEDERRRQEMFEGRYGRNAPRVPGAWGFLAHDHGVAAPFGVLGHPIAVPLREDEYGVADGFRVHEMRHPRRMFGPYRILGEDQAQAVARNLQEEADRRQEERGGANAIRLERERLLRERERERELELELEREHDHQLRQFERLRRLDREYNQLGLDVLNVDMNGQARRDHNNQFNAAQRLADRQQALLARLERMRDDLNVRFVHLQNPHANHVDRNGIQNRQRAVPANPAIALQARPLVQARNSVEVAQAPRLDAKKTEAQVKKGKGSSKPEVRMRKVDHLWQWIDRSPSPKAINQAQTQANKGEGSSKNKANINDQAQAPAGPSGSAKAKKVVHMIDLTTSSDEEDEEDEEAQLFDVDDDEDYGLIYL